MSYILAEIISSEDSEFLAELITRIRKEQGHGEILIRICPDRIAGMKRTDSYQPDSSGRWHRYFDLPKQR
jgi:hypothetical protein